MNTCYYGQNEPFQSRSAGAEIPLSAIGQAVCRLYQPVPTSVATSLLVHSTGYHVQAFVIRFFGSNGENLQSELVK